MGTGRYLVVVASADPPETDELADRLRDAVTVRTAYDVEDVLARLDDDVDVVLVDPALTDGTVGVVRATVDDRDLGCLVALLAETAPEDADAAVSPAVPNTTLREEILQLATEARYRKTLETYYETARTVARAEGTDDERERLQARLDRLVRRLDETAEQLDSATLFRAALDSDCEHD
jgi:hypothetical protein